MKLRKAIKMKLKTALKRAARASVGISPNKTVKKHLRDEMGIKSQRQMKNQVKKAVGIPVKKKKSLKSIFKSLF